MLAMLSAAIIAQSAERVAVQVDPRAFVFEIRRNLTAIPKDAVVVFNANYYWHGTPIGICSGWPSIVKYVAERPVLDLKTFTFVPGALSFQAGPTLVRGGLLLDQKKVQASEHFQDDIYRVCPHVSVGVSKAGKLIITYAEAWDLPKLGAFTLSLGAQNAMNLDGGHSAMLYVNGKRYGNPGLVPVAVVIRRRAP